MPYLNILHVVEDYSIHSGGLRTVIKELDEHLNRVDGVRSIILSARKQEGDDIYVLKSAIHRPWMFSRKWKSKINSIIKKEDINIIHIHGVWMYPNFIASFIAFKNKIPFVLTPHGMYEPWLWTKGRLKKKLYFNLFTKKSFSRASIIHGITRDEKNNLLKLFPNSKTEELPNLINLSKHSYNERSVIKGRYILFLGRLDEKKGIDLIIKCLPKLEDENVVLKIAGGFNAYKEKLEQLISNLNLKNRVEFIGLIKGEEKLKAYRNAFVFVAPSFSEVVGMVNLEAATQKTPVITTFQTGLNKEWNINGGLLINPRVEELITALNTALNWSEGERNENGKKLFEFVKENYSWKSGINRWIKLYSSIKN